MFKINPNPTFKVDVSIPVPGSKSEVLPIVFKHKTSTEIKKLIEQAQKNDTDTTPKNNITLLYDCIESWEADQKFDKKSFEAVIENFPMALSSIFSAYINSFYEAKTGN